MRASYLLATLLATALAATASAQSVTLTRTPSGTVRVGDTVTIEVNVTPAVGIDARGGGAEVTYSTALFDLVDAPLAGGNAAAAITRPGGANPYVGTAPPAWLTVSAGTGSIQLPIVRPTAELATTSAFSGTAATFRLRAKMQAPTATVGLTANTRLVPGAATTTTGLAFPIQAAATVAAVGDVACPLDGKVNSNDAVAVLRYDAEIAGSFSCFVQGCIEAPPCWFPGVADVNGDGLCNGNDAIEILVAYASPGSMVGNGTGGVDSPCPCPEPRTESPSESATETEPRFTLFAADADAVAGQEVTMTASVDSSIPAESFRVGLTFDPAVFSFVPESESSPGGVLVVNPEAPENIRVAAARIGAVADDPVLVSFRLRIAPNATPGAYEIGFLDQFARINGSGEGIASKPGTITVRREAGIPAWQEHQR